MWKLHEDSVNSDFRSYVKSTERAVLKMLALTLIWVGFLGVPFEVVGWGKISSLKLVRIMLETLHLARKYAPICSFRKYTF